MVLFISLSFVLLLWYAHTQYWYVAVWRKEKTFEIPQSFVPQQSVSVLIPARNEAANIGACLNSICVQHYPQHLLEIVVINDHSEDETAEIVASYAAKGVKLINLADVLQGEKINSYKKKALEVAVLQSRAEIVITTDADCIVSENWVRSIVCFLTQNNLQMLTAPVVFFEEKNLLQRFQSLDFCGMMAITQANVNTQRAMMSNGANLAYWRSCFLQVKGFEQIDHIASGDDMLLMEKINELYPQKIRFLKSKEAIVKTKAAPTLSTFLQQRIRWASKSKQYRNKNTNFQLIIVYFVNVFWVIWLLIGIFFQGKYIACFLLYFVIKAAADFYLLRSATTWFGRKDLLKIFFPAQIMHVLYIVTVGLLGNISQYAWKGRTVK
ncbi:MAG: glycosyltransferase [Chitinophagales bacterium]|nr:glycosyltransferase [Bacteroidota bacterium]MCB9043388.1 glycosyltransferase [Chitinophagales bacterium]